MNQDLAIANDTVTSLGQLVGFSSRLSSMSLLLLKTDQGAFSDP